MADRGTYVDIFFRNGLKEFEVLPPPDIWDSIKPVIRERHKTLTFYRIAAAASILLSISAFSYWFTREISKDFRGPAISLNQEITPEGEYLAENKIINIESSTFSPTISSEPQIIMPEHNAQSLERSGMILVSEGILFNTGKDEKWQIKNSGKKRSSADLINTSGSTLIESMNLNPEVSVPSARVNELNRWSISAMASPTYFSSISIENNETSADLLKAEKSAVSYSGGISFSYSLSRRITVQSGVYYSSIGQEVTGVSSYVGFHKYTDAKSGSQFGIQTSSGVIVSTNNDIYFQDQISSRVLSKYASTDMFDPVKADLTYLNNSVIQNFNYIEMPVFFRFKAIDRKLDLNFIGGLSYSMLIGNSSFAYVNGVKYVIGKTEGLSPINFSSSVGVGVEYNISGKISLNLEPTFRYYLTSTGGIIGSSIHPYSFGIFSGVSYKF